MDLPDTENVIDIDCKQLATIIHGVSHDPSIPWEECVEGDREEYDSDEDFLEDAYIDIRLSTLAIRSTTKTIVVLGVLLVLASECRWRRRWKLPRI
jgi:hypothetical protein